MAHTARGEDDDNDTGRRFVVSASRSYLSSVPSSSFLPLTWRTGHRNAKGEVAGEGELEKSGCQGELPSGEDEVSRTESCSLEKGTGCCFTCSRRGVCAEAAVAENGVHTRTLSVARFCCCGCCDWEGDVGGRPNGHGMRLSRDVGLRRSHGAALVESKNDDDGGSDIVR